MTQEDGMKASKLPTSFSLDQLAGDLAIQEETDFRRQWPHPVLLVDSIPPIDTEDIIINTEITDLKDHERSAARPDRRQVIPLVKSGNNQYTARITVGRARNNDIVIRASKISKLHAMFVPDEAGRYSLMDMGSMNGTEVNGRRLQPKESVLLKSGDRLAFWRCTFEYMELDDFIALLRRHAQK